MNPYLSLALGILCAAGGGELFVRGAVGLARWARVSAGLVAATVAAFATSSPELTVAVTSALAGVPTIALGDALGSNVVNIALILGVTAAIAPTATTPGSAKRDFPLALLGPIALALLLIDGELSRLDGLLLLGLFAAWLVAVVLSAREQRQAAAENPQTNLGWQIVTQCAVGLGLLIAAGWLIVGGARSIALAFGIDEFVVGATVVAVGTGAPELATTVIAKLRGHDEVSLGTVIGSNIFNGLLVVPLAALIAPFEVNPSRVGTALLFGVLAVALILPTRSGVLPRRRGAFLLVFYGIYVGAVLVQHY